MMLTLQDMKYMLEIEMFSVFPSLIDYTIAYCEYDRRYSRTHVGRQWYQFIKQNFPESLNPSFGFRMKSWDTFQYWMVRKYQVFGETDRANREKRAIIMFLDDMIAKCGNLSINV